ncbi:MFS transporter [Lacihabitans soyangensis]|uniref:MFS transporter n=1 Tax=Lacihabitans soyangensis TaxID=869394 RepID=A0AAE3H3Z6_9BACT|nr:MFS transporter [Lacihabitans soyangensis]MCP9762495.1 MFS transporter [Lacihabitans soyangensis]
MKIRHKVLFFLFLLSIITFLDRVCMNVVSKYVKEDLDLDNQSFGYILGAFSLAYALFELPTGILGDRIGPRKVLTRVVLWWSGFTALTGTAFGFVYLLIVRFLFGMGEAGAYPNASIAIARWFPAVEVGRAQSVIWAAGRIGGALTPLLVIPLVHLVGWRMAFFILGVVGSIWAAAWYYWFRDNPSEHKGITEKEIEEIETARKNAPISHKIHWKTIIKNPNIWLLMIMCHLFFYASYFFTNWSSTYFQEGRMMTEDQTKNFISLSYFLGAIGCIVGGFASDFLSKKLGLKLGRRIVGVAGLGLSSICFLGAGVTTDNQLAGYLLALCVFLKDLTLPVAFAVCVDIGKRNAGTVTGAMNFAGQMGGFFITIIFGTIVQQTGNFNYPLFLIAGCLIVASALWFFIDPTKEIVEG